MVIAIVGRMLPYAAKHGLRLITMNSRDYRESTPYTAEELADLANPDVEVQASAVRRWGREVALFLVYVCKVLHVPPVICQGSKKTGGLVLTTWSLSGVAAMSILGDARTLGDGLADTLAPYLRKVVLYGVYGLVRAYVWMKYLTLPHRLTIFYLWRRT